VEPIHQLRSFQASLIPEAYFAKSSPFSEVERLVTRGYTQERLNDTSKKSVKSSLTRYFM